MKKFSKKRMLSLKNVREKRGKKIPKVPRMWHLAKRLQPKQVKE
jgi:hypothetical protein